jgi:hypothetical protein
LTAGLYLEPSNVLPAGWESERAALPGVERVTRWENAHRDRSDLPRHIPEFDLLGLCEVDETFRPPPGDGYHFRRYPRPGQGILTGEETTGLLVVLIAPRRSEDAQALRDWADFIHIRHIAATAVPGYGMITPYELVGVPGRDDPRFLHLYEIHDDDPEAVFESMTKLVIQRIGGPGTAAFDEWAGHPALRIIYVNTFRRVRATAP